MGWTRLLRPVLELRLELDPSPEAWAESEAWARAAGANETI